MPSSEPSVLVIGSGASAVFTVVALRERAAADGVTPPRITVIGRDETPGLGLAYGHADAHHRLNSPASKMSLSAADDAAFVRWCEAEGRPTAPGDFVERQLFGRYVAETFGALLADDDSGVSFVRCDVLDVTTSDTEATATLVDGGQISADVAVLALGNPPPGLLDTGVDRQIDDPWVSGALDGVTEADRVLLVGTGLTMIDVATSLARRMPGIRMVATSRRLMLPAVHLTGPATPGPGLDDSLTTLGQMISAFGAQVRAGVADGTPWQAVLDGMRPKIQSLWMRLSTADQERFLSHAARPWDVHRHRMAPAVWTELSGLIDAGTLTLEADAARADFDVAVNCTGPRSVVDRGWSPLVDALLDSGTIRVDPVGLGLAGDENGAVHSADGTVDPRLFAIGTALKGTLWETVAIGEIRIGATRIATSILESVPVSA